MFVKKYQLKNFRFLLIDELDKTIGRIREDDFEKCLASKETFTEDGYVFYHVDKNKIQQYVQPI